MIPSIDIRDPEVRALADRAGAYVGGMPWCDAVTGCALAFAIAGVLGVLRVDRGRPGPESTVRSGS